MVEINVPIGLLPACGRQWKTENVAALNSAGVSNPVFRRHPAGGVRHCSVTYRQAAFPADMSGS